MLNGILFCFFCNLLLIGTLGYVKLTFFAIYVKLTSCYCCVLLTLKMHLYWVFLFLL
jgi:hypothetical protein